MIKVRPHNATHVRVSSDNDGIEMELSEHFTFYAHNYKHLPKYKSGVWDGLIRLWSSRTKLIYKGLVQDIIDFATKHDYEIEVDPSLLTTEKYSVEDIQKFIGLLKIPSKYELRPYQLEAIHHGITTQRSILEAATSSGKSFMIYSMIRFHLMKKRGVLLIVPNINLCKQMASDFAEYSEENGWDVQSKVHALYTGQERLFGAPVIISTWQTILSMVKNNPQNLKALQDRTDVIIGDEAHQFKSTEVSGVMDLFTEAEWRTGTTGTLDSITVNRLTLTGIFGQPKHIISARELMDQGYATPIEIRIIVINHPESIRKAMKGMKYDEEVKHIISNQARNQFIASLAKSCKGNTLILYNFVEKHGDLIYEKLKATIPSNRKVHYIHGGVDADEREQIRKIVETEEDSVILATASMMSTGTNMPSIENLILAKAEKSETRLRQSSGRTIRLKDGKFIAKVFDLADNYSYKKWTNTAMEHLDERIRIYSQEEFPMKVMDVELKY